ncbi:Hypothetical predicted protein [Cloeon dipterum]|uniref:Uncharacterized protein n=1 Tax=Cloeon dipterum TaxID=197152 RepID=A0A8S1DS46_9INSE|nr:Hypothetical predicted protein [Cloeon dipterum]
MDLSRARQPWLPQYMIGGAVLEYVRTQRLLGVHIARDLRWNHHVDVQRKKAAQTLGFAARNLRGCTQRVKRMAYLTLVSLYIISFPTTPTTYVFIQPDLVGPTVPSIPQAHPVADNMKSSQSNHETPETSMQAPENPEKFDFLDTAASDSVSSNMKKEALENVPLNLNPEVMPGSTSASLNTEASESIMQTLNHADSPHALDTEVTATFKIASDEETARKSNLNPEAQEFIPTVPRSSNQSTEQAQIQSWQPNIYYENQIFFAQYPLAQWYYPTMLMIPKNQYAPHWNNYAPTYTQNYGWKIQPYLNATPQMAPADCNNHNQENHPETGNFEVPEDKTPTMISAYGLPLASGNGSSQAPPCTKPNQKRSKRKHQKK